jgi:F-type H+-transporting ATPase subunit a
MNALKKPIRWVIVLVVLVFLCGVLPRIFPPILPTIHVEPEPILCIGGDTLLNHCVGGFAFTNSMAAMLLVDALLIVLFLTATRKARLVPTGLQNFMEWIIELLYKQCQQVAGKNAPRVFPVGATVFLIVLFANYFELIPGVDSIGRVQHAEENAQGYEIDRNTPEGSLFIWLNTHCPVITQAEYDQLTPADQQARANAGCRAPIQEGAPIEFRGWVIVPTVRTASTDINVTLALALSIFGAIQIYGIINHIPPGRSGVGGVLTGTRRYLSKFFNVSGLRNEGVGKIFGAVDLFASILELIGEFVKIISFTFRLFGNIFAGTVLIFVTMSIIPYIAPVAPLLLEVFVGVIQAYVFMMLAWVFMGVAAQVHGEHSEAH